MDGQRNDKAFQELLERVSRVEGQIQYLNYIQERNSGRVSQVEEGMDWATGQIQHLNYIQGRNGELEDRLHFLCPDDE
jgi:hypothetical protein